MKKRLFLATLVVCAIGFSVMVNNASAYCQITGKVMFTTQTQSGATVYLAPIGTGTWSFPSVYYSFTTPTSTPGGAAIAGKINNAQTSGARVTIYGGTSTSSCATTGNLRSGGAIYAVYQW